MSTRMPCAWASKHVLTADGIDFFLCLAILRRLSFPPVVCDLLFSQWAFRRRWVCFADWWHSLRSLTRRSFLERGPWSPACLTLCPLRPLRRQLRAVDGSRAFLFLDHHALLARIALLSVSRLGRSWNEFSGLTCAQTRDCKTQIWAHTIPAFEMRG